jgi:hypothetical protein
LTQGGEEELVSALTRASKDKGGGFVGVTKEAGTDSTLKIELEGRVRVGEALKEGAPDGSVGGRVVVVG